MATDILHDTSRVRDIACDLDAQVERCQHIASTIRDHLLPSARDALELRQDNLVRVALGDLKSADVLLGLLGEVLEQIERGVEAVDVETQRKPHTIAKPD